jgi:hypothetical protein
MSPMNNRLLVPRKVPGLLDLVPGAAAAYSLRSLSNSYAGPVVTVRRSSDDAEEDFTATAVADGTLAGFCGAGDGFVKQWWDQSGNARHAVAAADTNEPKIVDSGVVVLKEGKPAIEFDGSDDYLSFSAISLGTSHYISTVSYVEPGLTASILLGYTSPNNLNYDSGSGGRLYYNASNCVLGLNGAWPVSQQVLVSVERSGTTLTARTNGAQSSGTLSCNNPLTLSQIGFRTDLGAYPYKWNGTVQEILLYNSVPSNIDLAEGNIAWSYSV